MKADPNNWIGIQEFVIWDAACLLCDTEPFLPTRERPAPRSVRAMQARIVRELTPCRDETNASSWDWTASPRIQHLAIPGHLFYSRADLEEFAIKIGRTFLAGTAPPKRIIPMREPERRRDDWADVLRDAIRIFEQQFGGTPTAAQLWSQLTTAPPPGYAVTWSEDSRSLRMSDNPPLDRARFDARFALLYPKT